MSIWFLYWCLRINQMDKLVGRGFSESALAFVASFANPYLLIALVQVALGACVVPNEFTAHQITGFTMAIVGFAYIYTAHRALDGHYRPALFNEKPSALVTHGPYRHVRHPIYFGSFFMGLGTEIALWSGVFWLILASLPLLVVLTRKEEQKLLDMFGVEQFELFRTATPYRLIPFLY